MRNSTFLIYVQLFVPHTQFTPPNTHHTPLEAKQYVINLWRAYLKNDSAPNKNNKIVSGIRLLRRATLSARSLITDWIQNTNCVSKHRPRDRDHIKHLLSDSLATGFSETRLTRWVKTDWLGARASSFESDWSSSRPNMWWSCNVNNDCETRDERALFHIQLASKMLLESWVLALCSVSICSFGEY